MIFASITFFHMGILYSISPAKRISAFVPKDSTCDLFFFVLFSPNLSFAGMFEMLTSCLKNNFLPLWWKIRLGSEHCVQITGFLHLPTKWRSPDTKIKDVSTLICSSILPFHSCPRWALWISSSPFQFSWKISVSFYCLTSYHIGRWYSNASTVSHSGTL